MREELCIVGLGVVDHRVAEHIVLVVAHLYLIDADNLVQLGVDIATLRLEDVVATDEHSTATIATDICLGVECEVVGPQRSIAIDHLDDIGVDLRQIGLAIVLGSIAIDVGCTSLDKHIAEALDMTLVVAHRTIGRNDRTVVIGGKVSHYDHHLLTVDLHLPTLVRLHIDIVALGPLGRSINPLLASLGWRRRSKRREATATCKDQTRQRHECNKYGYYPPLHCAYLF